MFNMSSRSEVGQALLEVFRTLEKGVSTFLFRGRVLSARTNRKKRRYIEIPAHLSVKFRVYAPDDNGKATVMAIIDDLYAEVGQRGEKKLYDNPVLWGQVMRNTAKGLSLYFFNDPPVREALKEFKVQLVRDGVVTEPARIFTTEELKTLDATDRQAVEGGTP